MSSLCDLDKVIFMAVAHSICLEHWVPMAFTSTVMTSSTQVWLSYINPLFFTKGVWCLWLTEISRIKRHLSLKRVEWLKGESHARACPKGGSVEFYNGAQRHGKSLQSTFLYSTSSVFLVLYTVICPLKWQKHEILAWINWSERHKNVMCCVSKLQI